MMSTLERAGYRETPDARKNPYDRGGALDLPASEFDELLTFHIRVSAVDGAQDHFREKFLSIPYPEQVMALRAHKNDLDAMDR